MIFTSLLIVAPTTLVLEGLDPVHLVKGVRVLGNSAFSQTYLRHEYHFSTAQTMQTFKKNPLRFAVQNGGACGRMGALSGKGSPSRYESVGGNLYLFASESCRSTFLANREKFLAKVPSVSPGLPAEQDQAKDIWARIRTAHLGIAKPTGIQWTLEQPYKEKDVDKIWKSHFYVGVGQRLAKWEEWDAERSFFVRSGERFAEGKPGEIYDIHPDERRELLEEIGSTPAGLLMGYGEIIRPLHSGDGLIMRVGARVLTIRANPKTWQFSSISYTDHVDGMIADMEFVFNKFESFGGVLLPIEIQSRKNGGKWDLPRIERSYTVSGSLPIVFSDLPDVNPRS